MRLGILVFLGIATLCVCGSGQVLATEVILDEDFEDGVADGFEPVVGQFAISSGLRGSTQGYRATNAGHSVVRLPVNFRTGTISADFVIDHAVWGDFEIWFNASGVNESAAPGSYPVNGYAIGVNPSASDNPDAYLRRCVDEELTLLATRPNTISAGTTHSLGITRESTGDILIYLDDGLFFNVNDTTFFTGEVALRFFYRGTVDNITIVSDEEAVPVGALALLVTSLAMLGTGIVAVRERATTAE